jgi:hypothetical protein
MRKPTGFVLYRGPSLLDGHPIVAIAITAKSKNPKTGNMVQTYILRDDVAPTLAAKTGADASVCGDCKHRPALGGSCYVTLFHGPRAVYEAHRRGAYPDDDGYLASTAAYNRMVRIGTYGDPAAVPVEVWRALLRNSAGHTGYTHQWRNPRTDPALLGIVMASVDNDDEASEAILAGYRYFRVRRADEPMQAREFICPASHEAGKRRTCATCKACDGTTRPGQSSAVIIVHGSKANRFQGGANV